MNILKCDDGFHQNSEDNERTYYTLESYVRVEKRYIEHEFFEWCSLDSRTTSISTSEILNATFCNIMNQNKDDTHLLPRLSTDWECSVHSYSLNLKGSSANPEVEVMRLNCNAIEFDRSLKQQHLIEVLGNTVKMQHVKTCRWKKIIVSNSTNFQVSRTDLRNNPVNVKNDGAHALLIFRKKV